MLPSWTHHYNGNGSVVSYLTDWYTLDICEVSQQEEGNENMEKKFAVQLPGSFKYKTYEEAEKVAKQSTASSGTDYVIAQAVATAVTPIPEIEVVKL